MCSLSGIEDLNTLQDASEIYEQYFASIQKSLEQFENSSLLKVAGIVSLFRVIDVKNKAEILKITSLFNINEYDLIEKSKILHDLEVFDEYNGAYKISDQILAEYLIYKYFIKEQTIKFKQLLDIFYSEHLFSLWKVLTPIITNYGFENIKTLIINDVRDKWDELQINDPNKTIRYLQDFYQFLPLETLLFLKSGNEPLLLKSPEEYAFKIEDANSIEIYHDDIIDLLVKFRDYPDKFEIALDILSTYCLNKPKNFSNYLKSLTQSFSYKSSSNSFDFIIESKLLNYLYTKIIDNEELYTRIILFIAPHFLVNNFDIFFERHLDKAAPYVLNWW